MGVTGERLGEEHILSRRSLTLVLHSACSPSGVGGRQNDASTSPPLVDSPLSLFNIPPFLYSTTGTVASIPHPRRLTFPEQCQRSVCPHWHCRNVWWCHSLTCTLSLYLCPFPVRAYVEDEEPRASTGLCNDVGTVISLNFCYQRSRGEISTKFRG